MGVTVALALIAFVMFNAAGMQKKGVGGYIKGIVPHGVPGVLWPVIWVIEVISLLVRPFTLSIRLFANMYAGHIVLGIFSILTSIAVEQIIHGIEHAGVMDIAVGGIGMLAWMASAHGAVPSGDRRRDSAGVHLHAADDGLHLARRRGALDTVSARRRSPAEVAGAVPRVGPTTTKEDKVEFIGIGSHVRDRRSSARPLRSP